MAFGIVDVREIKILVETAFAHLEREDLSTRPWTISDEQYQREKYGKNWFDKLCKRTVTFWDAMNPTYRYLLWKPQAVAKTLVYDYNLYVVGSMIPFVFMSNPTLGNWYYNRLVAVMGEVAADRFVESHRQAYVREWDNRKDALDATIQGSILTDLIAYGDSPFDINVLKAYVDGLPT